MLAAFDAPADGLEGTTVLFARYNYEDYYGTAMVLFERDGRFSVPMKTGCMKSL